MSLKSIIIIHWSGSPDQSNPQHCQASHVQAASSEVEAGLGVEDEAEAAVEEVSEHLLNHEFLKKYVLCFQAASVVEVAAVVFLEAEEAEEAEVVALEEEVEEDLVAGAMVEEEEDTGEEAEVRIYSTLKTF